MSAVREARQILRSHRYGVLCTLSKKFDGHPFGSITPYLVDHDGSLLILISSLAEHTKNIPHDPRVSLIAHNQDDPHIQTQGRATVVGRALIAADKDTSGERYLRYFPESQTYFAMHDFSFYRIHPLAIRYIGGFGKIQWVNAADYTVAPCPLIEQESDFREQINLEYQNALRRTCQQVYGFESQHIQMIGVDTDGFDLRVDGRVLRFEFAETVTNAGSARQALAQLDPGG
ncbi:MAG: pyridoxamine 5'-phosphate oxidase family protein [Nitrosomonadales bacterium]